MAGGEKLKSLGGGRWESADGRYSVEPESGTWVVVDNEQTNEMGLPLVRGPFSTLTAAREAIAEFRIEGKAESPLAERLRTGTKDAGPKADKTRPRKPEPPPTPPPEPKWLRELDDVQRRRLRALVRRLDAAGIDDAEDVARAQVADNLPAVAQRALERKLAAARTVREAVDAILEGNDRELGAHWSLIDDDGREITRLKLDR